MSKDGKDLNYRAPALDKGLDIIELLALQPKGMTRSEIVKTLDKSPSEIYRMLERLVARNYVSRSFEGDRYALTVKLFHLATAHPPLRRLIAHVQPLMDDFASKSMQSIHLVVADTGHAQVVARASSKAAWEFRLRTGAMLGFLDTSSGQTLLAFQDDERAAQMLKLSADEHPDKRRGISAEIEEALTAIKEKGYRIGTSLQLAGVTDISVPVRSANDQTVAVLTCPFLPRIEKYPVDAEPLELDAVVELLLYTARQASSV